MGDHDDLQTFVAAWLGATGERRTRMLHELQSKLEAHFRAEDGPTGWFARALAAAPDLADRLEQLREDHLDLSARAVSLVHTPGEDLERRFVADLARHEEEEAAVLGAMLKRESAQKG